MTDIQQKINEAVAKKLAEKQPPKPKISVSCPVDPAERAACEGCQ